MKLFIESVMVFFGTLMTAALVALGRPASVELVTATQDAQPARQSAAQVLAATHRHASQATALPRAPR